MDLGAGRGMAPLPTVTTSLRPRPALEAEARATAGRFGLRYVTRAQLPLDPMLEAGGAALVFEERTIRLLDAIGSLRFHPGLAHLRLQRLESGEGDTLVRLAALRPGDSVLDCTLGQAQDARVAARAVGPTGRVTGVEHSLALAALQDAGFRRPTSRDARSAEIHVIHAEALDVLRARPDRSEDVILFDPMFSRPKKSQPGFEVLRRHAAEEPLSRELLEEAARVARRRVLVKAGRYGGDLHRLGLEPVGRTRSSELEWGIVDLESRVPRL